MLTVLIIAVGFHALQAVVPPGELYEDFNEIKNLNCRKVDESAECKKFHVIRVDFDCRYSNRATKIERDAAHPFKEVACFCCGAIYNYFEQGDICTRFCYESDVLEQKYGNYPAIVLPFNWGDSSKPDSARLADGSPFPIIPVNARLSRLVYGIETFEEEEVDVFDLVNKHINIGASVTHLANVMLLGMKSDKDNVIFSPLSLNSVLSLLLLGSKVGSKTEEELIDVLSRVISRERLKKLNKDIIDHYRSKEGVNYYNDILLSDSLVANTKFAEETYKYFGTDMAYYNTSEPKRAVEAMNEKISLRTNGYIPRAVKSLEDTDMIIINSLVFDLPWLSQFERTEKKMFFTKADGSKVKVPAMRVSTRNIKMSKVIVGRTKQTEMRMLRVPYATTEGYQSSLEMRIYLGPKQVKQSGVEFLLDSNQNVDNIFEQAATEEIDREITLLLPIFNAKTESDLGSFMKKNGINRIFGSEAELTEITKGQKKFFVKNINQEVVVNVTEYGTTAAAVTRLDLALLSADQPRVVIVNVPFIFSIWDSENNIPLIVGLINDPTQSN